MRTLLLEDDEATRFVFGKCIRDAGHDVLECGTIKQALTALRTARIDLLVLDLLIGNSNSLGLARYASYAAPNAEIILVTGSGEFAGGEVLRDCPSVTWILRKPLPLTDLEAFVSYAAKRLESMPIGIAS